MSYITNMVYARGHKTHNTTHKSLTQTDISYITNKLLIKSNVKDFTHK